MGGAEGIVNAFISLGETRKSTALAKRADPVAPSGQNFMRIGLMPDIPDQSVIGCVEDIMQRHCEFDDTQTRAQMPAGHRDRADHFGAQFIGQRFQLRRGEPPQLSGVADLVKQRGRNAAHARISS